MSLDKNESGYVWRVRVTNSSNQLFYINVRVIENNIVLRRCRNFCWQLVNSFFGISNYAVGYSNGNYLIWTKFWTIVDSRRFSEISGNNIPRSFRLIFDKITELIKHISVPSGIQNDGWIYISHLLFIIIFFLQVRFVTIR